jgi:hypothetical protein
MRLDWLQSSLALATRIVRGSNTQFKSLINMSQIAMFGDKMTRISSAQDLSNFGF